MRTIMALTNDKDEGIRFANSELPTSGVLRDMYCLHKDGTLWYMGMAARMKYHYERDSACCIDYERYVKGEQSYLVN